MPRKKSDPSEIASGNFSESEKPEVIALGVVEAVKPEVDSAEARAKIQLTVTEN